MEVQNENQRLPRWLSITGQPLELGLESGFRGRSTLLSIEDPNTHITAGQCISVTSFEKLNQLGEGSVYSMLSTDPNNAFTFSSLWRSIPRPRL